MDCDDGKGDEPLSASLIYKSSRSSTFILDTLRQRGSGNWGKVPLLPSYMAVRTDHTGGLKFDQLLKTIAIAGQLRDPLPDSTAIQ
jgi:hypothetical protein